MDLLNLVKREINIVIVSIFCFLLTVFGLSYGYITANSDNMSTNLSVASDNFSLVLTDNTTINETDIEPGDTFTKTITVQNRGSKSARYNLIWAELLNEIELGFSVTCSSNKQSNTCSGISTQAISMHSSEVNNVMIKRNISIDAGETHTYVVTVKFLDSEDLTEDYTSTRSFYGKINIEECDFVPSVLTLTTDNGDTGLDTGDIVTASKSGMPNQNFYIISTNASETVLFAQYNLYVGDIEESDENEVFSAEPISQSDSRYGLQNIIAKGIDYNSNQWIGGVTFSGRNYWYDNINDDIYSKYGTFNNYLNDVYDPNYSSVAPSTDYSDEFPYANENDYSISYYVERYMNTVGIEGTGRLLTYTEAISLGCVAFDNCLSAPSWVYTSSYFLGTATGNETLWIIDTEGSFIGGDGFYNGGGIYGVRPIIVVPTSNINLQ